MNEPKEVVLSFFKAFDKLDYESAYGHIADNCEYTNMPEGMGTVTGPEGVRAVFEPFYAPITENEFQIIRCIADGAVVFVERLDRHLRKGKWIELPAVGVFEVHDGKITLWRDYFDPKAMTSQVK